ncbi:4-hydroxylaminobenzoate lyase [Paraburkholderia saeva]|uniref:DUF4863 domain-containing protein n=1 Tax=Paraburkholderia saeva TaxID=2777537 RepID=A0A9N8S0B8_9BURK|nr:DUF4863 family protein [Paraburkholderia saeva]CAG4915018.1 hypothetical protein R52603_04299 [Paraburkholderia saeva]CAG4922363.1 hypothetical protein LMG31841_05182 [Paraburkholderia saeva]
MSPDTFRTLIGGVTSRIASRPLGQDLARWLNTEYPASGTAWAELADACCTGVKEGWLCDGEAGGIRYGRIFKALPETHGFSVDVVSMTDIAGPHHVHPNGEIDLIIPLTEGATFDGHPAGWCVYEPGSAHRPTVAHGSALVLYLLPEGAIQFTKQEATA